MTRLRSLREDLNRWMLGYVSPAILVGLLAGNGLAGFARSQAGLLGALTTVAVALSFILVIVAVPAWMALFASRYQIAVPMGDLINSILTVLVAPMVLGYATRRGLLRWLGPQRFGAIAPTAFSPLVAIPAATMPIFQILLLVLYLRSADRLRGWFGPRRAPVAVEQPA